MSSTHRHNTLTPCTNSFCANYGVGADSIPLREGGYDRKDKINMNDKRNKWDKINVIGGDGESNTNSSTGYGYLDITNPNFTYDILSRKEFYQFKE